MVYGVNIGSNAPLNDRREVILHAFDKGIFHFDVANNYGNDGSEFGSTENLFGQILSQELKAYRNELVISTRAGYEIHDGPYGIGTSRKSLFQGINDSLKRLQLDYEAIQLFKDLGTPFVLDQMSMNMLNTQVDDSGLTELLQKNGAALIAYGPLAEGLLSNRYLEGIPDNFRIHHTNRELLADGEAALVVKLKALNELALERGQTLSQLALAWLLRDPVVASVIIGTTSIEHLDDNLKALEQLEFSDEEQIKITELLH